MLHRPCDRSPLSSGVSLRPLVPWSRRWPIQAADASWPRPSKPSNPVATSSRAWSRAGAAATMPARYAQKAEQVTLTAQSRGSPMQLTSRHNRCVPARVTRGPGSPLSPALASSKSRKIRQKSYCGVNCLYPRQFEPQSSFCYIKSSKVPGKI